MEASSCVKEQSLPLFNTSTSDFKLLKLNQNMSTFALSRPWSCMESTWSLESLTKCNATAIITEKDAKSGM